MAQDLTQIKMGEMRPNLFRIHWNFQKLMKKSGHLDLGIYKQEFQLCGAQQGVSGRKFSITCHLKSVDGNNMRQFTITVEEITRKPTSSEEKPVHSTSHETQPKRQKLDLKELQSYFQRLEHIWMHVGPLSDGYNPLPLIETKTGGWQADCSGKTLTVCFILWMDFGSNTVSEKKTATRLSALFKNQFMCDVQFLFKDGHQSIGAHAAILSASSPVFAAMFQSDFVESKKRQVNIDNIEPQIFNHLLSFFYCGTAPKLTEIKSIQLLLQAAHMYDIEALENECVNMWKKQLRLDNALEMLICSHANSVATPELYETTMAFFLKNIRIFSAQPECLEIMKKHPELCLQVNKQLEVMELPYTGK
jgi:hypothetical protein